jgi:copper(I)-binding protein
VTLQGASAEGAGRIELHESLLGDDDTMTMQARPDGFVIAAGETITLEPGGKHLMIFDPLGTDDLTVSLNFGDETVEVLAAYDAEASAAVSTDDAMHDMDADAMADTDG